MDESKLTYADYKRFAKLPLAELERDCRFEAFHAHGPGGQAVNTADSAVRLVHEPTGLVVLSRTSRSQFRNRQLCLKKLKLELAKRAVPPRHRRPTMPTHASVLARLVSKKKRSELKALRRKPTNDD